MICKLKTSEFELEYIESEIDTPVIWESHCHGQFEMIAVIDGDINVMVEGKIYRLTENQTIIIPPLHYHSVTANKKGFYRRVTALFDLFAIPEVLRVEFLKNDAYMAIAQSSQIKTLKNICLENDPSFYAPLAQSAMIRLFYDALQAKNEYTAAHTDDFLQKVILYIDRHLHEKILLDDLAKYTSRSKSSFCHLFEEKMNISPKQYILQKKMALASKLIGDGTPPTLAATQVGYENYSNFYRMYQKHFGTSPGKNEL